MDSNHEIEWTPQKVSRIWGYYSKIELDNESYFSRQVGGYVVRKIQRSLDLSNKTIVDYGAGPGYLFDHLASRVSSFSYLAADHSKESLDTLTKRLQGNPRFGGTVSLPASDNARGKYADLVVVCEVVEHLDDAGLAQMVSDCRSLLKPDGLICITTPNDENLVQSKVCCPECGCIFHRWQHVRSWSRETLQAFLATNGFKTLVCHETVFGSLARALAYRMFKKGFSSRPLPNLYYLGTVVSAP